MVGRRAIAAPAFLASRRRARVKGFDSFYHRPIEPHKRLGYAGRDPPLASSRGKP
jgi:hypothetical protein